MYTHIGGPVIYAMFFGRPINRKYVFPSLHCNLDCDASRQIQWYAILLVTQVFVVWQQSYMQIINY